MTIRLGLLMLFCAIATFPVNILSADSKNKAIIKKGDYFPEISLDLPAESEHLMYLGIKKGAGFTIRDIQADLIVVEIMNINCPSCQRQAPINNKLYSLIESTPETKGKIKMIAIAAGCADVYIKQFVEHFKTPYPVIQDPKFIVYDAIGRSPIPLAVFVRKDPLSGEVVVAGTHSGFDSDFEGMFKEMQRLMRIDSATVRDEGKKIQARVAEIKPIITEAELKQKIKTAFAKEGGEISGFRKVELQTGRTVYTSGVEQNGKRKSLFGAVVSRPAPCDICHDVHFIYVFDATGKILQFVPVQLTKYGNKTWDDHDIEKMRKRVVGRYIYQPFDFDPGIDAVTSATITSSVIFNSLEDDLHLFRELREKGLIRIPNRKP